jgi:hypothetical protein
VSGCSFRKGPFLCVCVRERAREGGTDCVVGVYLFLWLMYVSDGSFLFIFGLSVAVMVFEIVG